MASSDSTFRSGSSEATVDERGAVSGAEVPAIAWRVGDGRLLVDVGSLLEKSAILDPSAPGFDEWMRIRQTLTVFPFPRGDRRPMAEGVIREELERHAVELGRRCEINMIVDRRLERLLPESESTGSASHLLPASIKTNWGEDPQSASGNRWSRFFARHVMGRKPAPAPSASRRNEQIEVGLGKIRTESGRERLRQNTVTMAFHEPNSSDRIEVRIVGLDRVIRLRFDSRRDPRFQMFWPRWLG
ncbi:MAG: hypothetical protein P8J59_05250 [Phycisphaerales bacterium]|jgi:hypothetical protein|nr:hypothetical protein [Phycisphaerales bacterium]